VVLPHGVHQDVGVEEERFPLYPSAMSLDPLVEVPAFPLLVVLGDVGTGQSEELARRPGFLPAPLLSEAQHLGRLAQ